jgi:hypothetical protein
MRSGISRVRVILPVAVMVGLLFAILLVGIQVNNAKHGAVTSSRQATVVGSEVTNTPSVPTSTVGPIQPIATVIPPSHAATTTPVPGNGGPNGTSPTQQGVPSIEVVSPCTSVIDVSQNQLHVCGNNFTSGTSVTIYYHIGTTIKKHTVQVGADGTFNDVLYIQSCNDVPGSIYVQNSSNPAETAQIAKNITFGTCQGFGNLKKPKNNG